MKNLYVPFAAFAFLMMASCKKELEPQHHLFTAKDTTSAKAVNPANGLSSKPGTAQGVAVAGVNPPHGQPGHRCDIAVGAPLNSAPGATAAKPQTTSQTTTVTPEMLKGNTTNAVTAPGMNPPHGQPGHRCDLAVGAPLSTPVAKTASKSGSASIAPTPLTGGSKVAPTAPGMNPPHGQPGHRCDIAVGAPLDSKPAVTGTPAAVPATLQAPPTATEGNKE